MFKIRIFLMFVGSFLVGLGLIVSLSPVVTGILDPQPTLSPFDETDDIIAPEQGFAPIVITPTLPPLTNLKDQVQSATQETGQNQATPTPASTVTPVPIWVPDRIVIPAIQLDAPVVSTTLRTIAYLGKNYPQWKVPDFFAAGWAPTSASLGVMSNTVLFGHHNTEGEVFAHLVDLQLDDLLILYSGEREFAYIVALKMILPERNQPVDIRLQNARWILPSSDERLTLLTCWPYVSNTHRLIIVAIPISLDDVKDYPVTPRFTPQALP
jgi:sortase A